jgi:tetratricopeptide (TPR) repeat protein
MFKNIFGKTVSKRPDNPYVTGNVVGGSPAFIGRADILREVEDLLRHQQQNAVVFFGQRRIGKTSVLKELESTLSKNGDYQPIYFDLLGKAHQPISTILEELADKISQKLGQPTCQLGDHPKRSFHNWLSALLNSTNLSETSLVLLFDEFDALDEKTSTEPTREEFFHYLREELLPLNPTRLKFVFAIGRNISDLTQIVLALFRVQESHRVSLLTEKDTYQLVRLAENNQSLYWSTKALKKVRELTKGHPYLTQLLCSCVWEQIWSADQKYSTQVPTVKTPGQVEKAIACILERGGSALEWLWTGLPAECRIVSAALAKLAEKQAISKEELINYLYDNGISTVVAELENAPQILKDWDILEESSQGQYRFRVELFRQWIVAQKPLGITIQEELGRIRKEADDAYQEGLSLYQNQQWDDACDRLNRAIRINLHHIEARKLLATVLVEKGELTPAIESLKDFYKYYPDVARPQLTELLWTQLQSATERKTQLELCTQILEYDLNHSNAKRKVRDVWQWRGDRYKNEDDLEKAYEAYQKAFSTYPSDELERKLKEVKKAILLRRYLEPVLYVAGFILSLSISYWLWPAPSSNAIILEVEKQENGYLLSIPANPFDSLTLRFKVSADVPPIKAVYKENETSKSLDNQSAHPSYQYVLPKEQLKGERKETVELREIKQQINNFTCEVAPKMSCDVKPSGYFSLQSIPWWIVGSIVGIILVVVIKLLFLLKNRIARHVF